MPKNSFGLFAGIEWNELSGLMGINYERSVYHNGKFDIGIKAIHILRYKIANLDISNSSNQGTASLSAVLCTGYLYTSKRKDNSGFFLYTALGPGLKKKKYYDNQQTVFIAAFEAGLGWQFFISNHLTFKWSNSIFFAADGGITISKISLGF